MPYLLEKATDQNFIWFRFETPDNNRKQFIFFSKQIYQKIILTSFILD